MASLLLVAGTAGAQTVGAVVNAASNALTGLPNSSIAQGSIFVVYGTGLGPAEIAHSSSFPLPKNLSGTSVQVTVGGTTVDGIMLYTLATQIAAILPSSTPPGTGTITVSFNGSTSSPMPITVVPSTFGTFTVNQQGSGPGIITFPDYSLVTPTKAANPSEILIAWGTGLGAVIGDEAAQPLPGDFSVHPAVWVGNQQAEVQYAGRSGCCAGLDQIVFVVPPGIAGCNISLAIQTGDIVSNFSNLSIAATGRVCSDTGFPTGADLTTFFSKGNFRYGGVTLTRSSIETEGIGGIGGGTTKSDDGSAVFLDITIPAGQIPTNLIDSSSYGSCSVTMYSGQSVNIFAGFTLTSLDAGSSIGVTGSPGNRTLTKTTAGNFTVYGAKLGDTSPGNYLDPGSYTISGTGGPDVAAFNVQITVPPALTWTNQDAISAVTRSNGQLVTWSGGDPAGYVDITGSSTLVIGTTSAIGASFACREHTSAGSFMIPASVTLAMPASASIGGFAFPGTLGISAASLPTQFTATGLDLGFANSLVSASKEVAYQ